MPSYHYVALNQEHKELSGVIEAPDEPLARQKLNELSLSVVSLALLAADAAASSSGDQGKKIRFEFDAFDKNGKKIVGTIVSEDPLKAYARLFDEYSLNVVALFSAALSEQDKEQARKIGIESLRKQYEKTYGQKKKNLELQPAIELQEQRKELLGKVDFTTDRIEIFLKEFGGELKTEERETIQSYLNQLMRIKDSNNLPHIRSTCERMLDYIQKQELFINEGKRIRENTKLKVETQQMLDQLKHTGAKKEFDLVKIAVDWKEHHPLFKFLGNAILKLFSAQDPEIRKLREEISNVNGQIWSYIKIFIFGKSKIMRSEAWISIKTLFEEKKRLKRKIKTMKINAAGLITPDRVRSGIFLQNATSVIGWILSFYLLSYMIAYPFTVKSFKIAIPQNLFFYSTYFTKGATIFLFIAYAALTANGFWFKQRRFLGYIVHFAGIFGFLLILINLM